MMPFFEFHFYQPTILYGPELYSREGPVGIDGGEVVFDELRRDYPEEPDPATPHNPRLIRWGT